MFNKSSHRVLKPVRLGKAINKTFPTVMDEKFYYTYGQLQKRS